MVHIQYFTLLSASMAMRHVEHRTVAFEIRPEFKKKTNQPNTKNRQKTDDNNHLLWIVSIGAGEETLTLDLFLGKEAL